MTTVRKLFAALMIAALAAPAQAAEVKQGPSGPVLPRVSLPTAPATPMTLPTAIPQAVSAAEVLLPAPAVPSIPAALSQAQPQGVAQVVSAVAPQLEAIAKPEATAAVSAIAAENVSTILQGGKAVDASGSPTVAAAPGQAPAPLAKRTVTVAKQDATVAASPASPQAKEPKTVNSYLGYKLRRAALAFIATHWGVVYSMPPASPALTKRILENKAREAEVFFSDIDDTLTKFNTLLPKAQAENVEGIAAAGKVFAAITDRPDKSKPGSSTMGALESMSVLREDKRDGVIVATNGGGKIYEYQKGEPVMIYEEPSLPESQRPLIDEAANAVKSQLAAHGTAIFEKNPGGPGPYGHSMIFNGGTPEATVKALAHVFEAELRKRGLNYEVEGRMAKDPTLPPYITFSKLNKSLAVRRIIEVKKLQGKKAVGMGDSMYAPVKPAELAGWKARTAPWALKLGRWVSGRDVPLTGNRTDANMEGGKPGMTMLSVGLTGDPRMKDGWVLSGKGPEQSAQILIEGARNPLGSWWSREDGAGPVILGVFMVLAAIAVGALAAYYVFGTILSDMLSAAESQLRDLPRGGFWPF